MKPIAGEKGNPDHRRYFPILMSTSTVYRAGKLPVGKTCSEENGMGDNEFLPWQIGAVM
jgi:hypothetical protein